VMQNIWAEAVGVVVRSCAGEGEAKNPQNLGKNDEDEVRGA
jgi:hypothetical protein